MSERFYFRLRNKDDGTKVGPIDSLNVVRSFDA